MQLQKLLSRAAVVLAAGITMLACSGWASADPPSRVARLGYATGAISFSPAGENEWIQATINRPLTTGDRLWADAGARAEMEVGGAMLRMNAGTYVSILNLDDRIVQLQLTQGTINLRVRRLEANQVFEIDTPNLAFTVRQPGDYRISVDAEGNATDIVVRRGQGDVYGEGASYRVDSRQPYRFTGTGLRDYQNFDAPRADEFDRWSSDRDRSYDNSASARYVSQDVIGYQDLDANGTWRADPTYGNVWIPTRVAADWAPYRDGHWAWVDPWGWTWVDDAPWGFAVSHYGRWTNIRGTWGWVPGPVRTRAYYAPALVAFVGGSNFQVAISGVNVGGVAWFPLGPREVYRPSYAVSRGYFENVNRSNTIINTTVVNNYYNNSNVTNVVYANRQVAGAVVAVPTTTFVQSQQVRTAVVRVTPAMVASAQVAAVPTVAPTQRSVLGAANPSEKAPPSRVFDRAIVARTALPAPTVGFAAQQQQLAAKPGKPLEENTRRELKPVAAAPVPAVKVIVPSQIAPVTAIPPAAPAQRATPAVPVPPQVVTRSPQVQAPSTPMQPREQRGKPDQRGEQPSPPARVAPPVAPAPPPEQRGKPEQRGEQRGQPNMPTPAPQIAPTPVPPQRVVPTPPAQPQVAPPVMPPPARVAPQVGPAPTQRAVPTPPVQPQVASPAPVQRAAPIPPNAQPKGPDAKPATGKPDEKKKDNDEQKREDDPRKQKN